MRAERGRCCVSGASYNNGIRMVRGTLQKTKKIKDVALSVVASESEWMSRMPRRLLEVSVLETRTSTKTWYRSQVRVLLSLISNFQKSYSFVEDFDAHGFVYSKQSSLASLQRRRLRPSTQRASS